MTEEKQSNAEEHEEFGRLAGFDPDARLADDPRDLLESQAKNLPGEEGVVSESANEAPVISDDPTLIPIMEWDKILQERVENLQDQADAVFNPPPAPVNPFDDDNENPEVGFDAEAALNEAYTDPQDFLNPKDAVQMPPFGQREENDTSEQDTNGIPIDSSVNDDPNTPNDNPPQYVNVIEENPNGGPTIINNNPDPTQAPPPAAEEPQTGQESSSGDEVMDGGPDPAAPTAEQEPAAEQDASSSSSEDVIEAGSTDDFVIVEGDSASEESQDSSDDGSGDPPDYPVPDPPRVSSGAGVGGETDPPPVGSDPGLVAESEAPPIYTADEVYEVGENPPLQEDDSFDVREHLGLETWADDPREQVTGPPPGLLADTESDPVRSGDIANPKPFEIDPDVINAITYDPSLGEPTPDPPLVDERPGTPIDPVPLDAEAFERATGVNPEEDRLADDPREQVSGPPPGLLADTQTPWSASEEPQPFGEEQRDSSSGGDPGQDVPEISEQPLGPPAGYALGPDTGPSGVEEWGGVPINPRAEDALGVAGQETSKAGSAPGEEIPNLPSEIPSDDNAGGGYDLTNVSRQIDTSYDPAALLRYQAEQEEDHIAEQADTVDDAGI